MGGGDKRLVGGREGGEGREEGGRSRPGFPPVFFLVAVHRLFNVFFNVFLGFSKGVVVGQHFDAPNTFRCPKHISMPRTLQLVPKPLAARPPRIPCKVFRVHLAAAGIGKHQNTNPKALKPESPKALKP